MSFEADDPTSPLFIILMLGFLVAAVYAWSGLFKGELPNMRTSIRGARVAGAMAVVALLSLIASYYYFTEVGELKGTIAAVVAAGALFGGMILAERIPD